ncbi:MAG TPA: hypothetical protein VJG66_01350 [Patescibacteria group bacterium]|nr:hypothetical protein [Patescibacteria group bacterium]
MTVLSPEAPLIRLSDLKKDSLLPPKISLTAHEIRAHTWKEIVDKTDKTGAEYGSISSFHKGKVYHGGVSKGHAERPDHEGPPGSKERAGWGPSLFPHGLSSWRYINGMEDILMIHGHPMPSEVDHIKTTHHSITDVKYFFDSNLWASIVLDRGGAHLLRRYSQRFKETIDAKKLVGQSYEGKERVIEVISALGEKMEPYGIQYFYTPEINFTEGGIVVFTDARFLERKVEESAPRSA